MRMTVNPADGGPFTDEGLITATVTAADIPATSRASDSVRRPRPHDRRLGGDVGIDDNDTSFADRITSDEAVVTDNVEMTDGVPATVYYSLNGTDGWVTDPDDLSLTQGSNRSVQAGRRGGNESQAASVAFD